MLIEVQGKAINPANVCNIEPYKEGECSIWFKNGKYTTVELTVSEVVKILNSH